MFLFFLSLQRGWAEEYQASVDTVILRMDIKDLILVRKKVIGIDVRGCASLEELRVQGNELDTIDVSDCASLEVLEMAENSGFTYLDVSQTKLPALNVKGYGLASLKAMHCPALERLDCSDNILKELDIEGSGSIDTLDCRNNHLPLQTLYTVLQERNQNATFLLGTQYGDKQTLRMEDAMDMRPFLMVGGTESDVEVNSLFRQPVPAYRYTFSNGYLRFHANGDYRVLQTHPEVRDYLNGIAGDPVMMNWAVDVEPSVGQITWFDCGNETASEATGYRVSALDVRGCPNLKYLDCRNNHLTTLGLGNQSPIMELHAENNAMSLSTVYSLLAARHRSASYRFSPQESALMKYLEIGEDLDLHSEFMIDDCPSEYALYSEAGEEVPSGSYTLKSGVLNIQYPGTYRLELNNRAVTDYMENGGMGSPVIYNYWMTVGASSSLYTVRVRTEDPVKGTVTGGGAYELGAYTTVTATANSGYEFSHWKNKGVYFSEQRILALQVNEDLDLMAYFTQRTANESQTGTEIKVFAKDRVIYLSGAVGEVRVFTVAGQPIYAGRNRTIPVAIPGVYLVQIGAVCHKVMVF